MASKRNLSVDDLSSKCQRISDIDLDECIKDKCLLKTVARILIDETKSSEGKSIEDLKESLEFRVEYSVGEMEMRVESMKIKLDSVQDRLNETIYKLEESIKSNAKIETCEQLCKLITKGPFKDKNETTKRNLQFSNLGRFYEYKPKHDSPSTAVMAQDIDDVEYYLNEDGGKRIGYNYLIHDAASCGCLTMVKFFLSKNPDALNAQCSYEHDATPLMFACEYPCEKIVNYLLMKGANVKMKCSNGKTTLMKASFAGSINIVKILINHIADAEIETFVNEKDDDGRTAIMMASHIGNEEIVEMLIENAADVNAIDKYGKTALLLAAQYGHKDVVKQLLRNKADVNVVDKFGYTALDKAEEYGEYEIAEIIRKFQ